MGQTATQDKVIDPKATNTPYTRVHPYKLTEFSTFFKDAQQLSKAIEEYNNQPGQEHKIRNYVKEYKAPFGKTTQENMNQLHSAVAKTFIEIAVARCLTSGMKLEDLSNIKITLDNNKQMSYSLLDKNGKPITNPEEIIGKMVNGKFDFDGKSNRKLDSSDGKAELFTARLIGYRDRPINNCNHQLLEKCIDILGQLPAPAVQEAPPKMNLPQKVEIPTRGKPRTLASIEETERTIAFKDESPIGKPTDPKFVPPGTRRGFGILPIADFIRECVRRCLPLPGITK